jgi:site-specific recombinase
VSAVPSELQPFLDALDPRASLGARLEALENLARLHFDIGGLRNPGPAQIVRLRALLAALEAAPDFRERLRATLGAVLRETAGVALFSEAGIPNDRGLASETIDRVSRRVLPRPPDDQNLERFVSRVFRRPRDCAWIEAAPPALFAELAVALGDIWAPVRDAMSDAIALLATRVSALGLSVNLRERTDPMHVRDSPFFRIPHVPLEEMPMLILECRTQLARIHERLETTGVSTDVVYCIDAIRRMLLRIERMLPFLLGRGDAVAARTLLGALTAGRIADESLRQLGRQNLGLLAKKVIERVGHTGEHYVTSTRREYWKMFASAIGGGAVIPPTVIFKFLALWAEFAPFVEGVLVSGVYVASFVTMQLLGFTLATKQPSATAAALAATIKGAGAGEGRLEDLVGLIARISRSQLAAAVGNIIAVVTVAPLLDLMWVGSTGHHFFDEHASRHALESIDPRNASTIWFGALTGIMLWISSLGAGWLENWVTFRRLPDAIRHHRLGHVIGRQRMDRIATFVGAHSAGFGGNITLGTLFGMAPKIGAFFGIPLDSRHFTISTAMLVLAGCSLGLGAITIWSVLGIATLGLLNFGVSFVLALTVAFRARDVTSRERVGLALSVARSFVRRPLRFLYPVSERAR